MKKLTNSVSPFLMLLVPVLLLAGLSLIHVDNQIPASRYNASINLQTPSFRVFVQSIF